MKQRTIINTTLGALMLATLLMGSAFAYGHAWMKMSQANVQNAYGSPVVQCVWRCQTYGHNNHTTVTQGHGYCPRPY